MLFNLTETARSVRSASTGTKLPCLNKSKPSARLAAIGPLRQAKIKRISCRRVSRLGIRSKRDRSPPQANRAHPTTSHSLPLQESILISTVGCSTLETSTKADQTTTVPQSQRERRSSLNHVNGISSSPERTTLSLFQVPAARTQRPVLV